MNPSSSSSRSLSLAPSRSTTSKAAQLDFIGDQFRAVVGILRRDSYDTATGRPLATATAAAQLAQTAGFMAYESKRDGEAQRWYLTGLRAAHAAPTGPWPPASSAS